MTQTVTMHEAKTHLSRLIEDVLAGQEVIIARGKQPVAKLVPLDGEPKDRVPGAWKGLVKEHADTWEPWTDDELGNWFDKPLLPE